MNHIPEYDHSYWLKNVIRTDQLKPTIDKAVKRLRRKDFDSIAFRGMSGALISPSIACRLKKTMLMVRKKSRGDHASRMVEGDRAAKKYLIVDDFRSTGYTTKEIIKKVKQFAPDAECVGAYFYNTDRFESDVDLLKKERT